jgi:hypothetical protein
VDAVGVGGRTRVRGFILQCRSSGLFFGGGGAWIGRRDGCHAVLGGREGRRRTCVVFLSGCLHDWTVRVSHLSKRTRASCRVKVRMQPDDLCMQPDVYRVT